MTLRPRDPPLKSIFYCSTSIPARRPIIMAHPFLQFSPRVLLFYCNLPVAYMYNTHMTYKLDAPHALGCASPLSHKALLKETTYIILLLLLWICLSLSRCTSLTPRILQYASKYVKGNAAPRLRMHPRGGWAWVEARTFAAERDPSAAYYKDVEKRTRRIHLYLSLYNWRVAPRV